MVSSFRHHFVHGCCVTVSLVSWGATRFWGAATGSSSGSSWYLDEDAADASVPSGQPRVDKWTHRAGHLAFNIVMGRVIVNRPHHHALPDNRAARPEIPSTATERPAILPRDVCCPDQIRCGTPSMKGAPFTGPRWNDTKTPSAARLRGTAGGTAQTSGPRCRPCRRDPSYSSPSGH
jgi:hypothetical protein